MPNKRSLLGLLALLMASLAYTQPFTYQGFLKESGTPANGAYSMTFRLFNFASGGTALSTVGPVDVSVSNGLFTRELNFGSVWTGEDRYLEIQVGSIVLAPRVKINPAPYAGYSTATRGLNVDGALNVGLTALRRTVGFNPVDNFPHDGKAMGHYALGWFDDSWNNVGATAWLSGFAGIKLFTYGTPRLTINVAGMVGIGTTSPNSPLTIQGTGANSEWIQLRNNSGANRWNLNNLNGGLNFAESGVADARLYIAPGGNIGVGISNPLHRLHVETNASALAIYGRHTGSTGVNYGVYGQSDSTQGSGVKGVATAGSGSPVGVYGESASPEGRGVTGIALASSGIAWGVFGATNSTNSFANGVIGFEPDGSPGHAIYAFGSLAASGTKSFQIDHPLRHETHLLNHFCTEGPEPYNAYSGVVVLDARGEAWVELPTYFSEINRDPRYTLTPIGAPMPNLYVAVKIQGNRFKIAGGAPGKEVSWRVEAIRNDRWVQQYGYQTEQEKPAEYQGKYLHPELYGQPRERAIYYDPERRIPNDKLSSK